MAVLTLQAELFRRNRIWSGRVRERDPGVSSITDPILVLAGLA